MTINMAKSAITVRRKTRGRPPIGSPLKLLSFRASADQTARVDQWAGKQVDEPDRSEAIRRLIDMGLMAWPSARPHSPQTRAKAAALAAETIDRHTDQSAPPEEQASRKRRLLKGPKEFRDLRKDHK